MAAAKERVYIDRNALEEKLRDLSVEFETVEQPEVRGLHLKVYNC